MSFLKLPTIIFKAPNHSKVAQEFFDRGIDFIELLDNENNAYIALEPIELYNVLRIKEVTEFFLVYGDGSMELRDNKERIIKQVGKMSINTKESKGMFRDAFDVFYEVKP
jgi:hypothetical protein